MYHRSDPMRYVDMFLSKNRTQQSVVFFLSNGMVFFQGNVKSKPYASLLDKGVK